MADGLVEEIRCRQANAADDYDQRDNRQRIFQLLLPVQRILLAHRASNRTLQRPEQIRLRSTVNRRQNHLPMTQSEFVVSTENSFLSDR